MNELLLSGRVIIPKYYINKGLDIKFDNNPFDIFSNMTFNEYKFVINNINSRIKPARKNYIDFSLMAISPLVFPLIPSSYTSLL